MLKSELYTQKKENYFSNARWDIINLIPVGNHKILEVGCGNGATLCALKKNMKAHQVYGVEISDKLSKYLEEHLDGFITGDVELLNIPFEENSFDFIIFGDVLEHLVSPEIVLRKYGKLLKKDGYIIASIPNIKYYSVLLNLIFFDKFEYTESGILDKSHLRFFTKKQIIKMFQSENFEITHIQPNFWLPIQNIDNMLFKMLSKFLPGGSFFTVQYIVKAKRQSLI